MRTGLHAPERKIIKSLLVKKFGNHTPFLTQLRSVKQTERRFTGAGYYLEFLNSGLNAIDDLSGEVTEGFRTTLKPPQDMVGFTLFIRDGRLSWLEGYTFGDASWPEAPMESWLKFNATSNAVPGDVHGYRL